MPQDRAALVPVLHNIATQLRIDSIRSTTAAGKRASDVMRVGRRPGRGAVLRRDAVRPAASATPVERSIRALEGACGAAALRGVGCRGLHPARRAAEAPQDSIPISRDIPTPRLPFVDVATGSLGQGLAAALGIAFNAQRIGSDYRTYALLGDGETAEGSVWEVAELASLPEDRQPRGPDRRQPARTEPSDDVAAQPRRARATLERVRLERASSSTATISTPSSTRWPRRARRRAGRR